MDRLRPMSNLFPWHHQQWRRLVDACKRDRLGHALLLRGRPGLGIPQFARHFATALLCGESISETWPCGACQSCAFNSAGSHPDLVVVEPEEGRLRIGVAQVRYLIEALSLAPKFSEHQVAILSPAEQLTREAANGLLKNLEEPPGEVVFLLVSYNSTAVPATIRSRCQLIDFPTPQRAVAREWVAKQIPEDSDADWVLDVAGGAPLRALDIMLQGQLTLRDKILESFVDVVRGQADPLEVARSWQVVGTREALEWLASLTTDCIKLSYGETASRLVNRDVLPALNQLLELVERRCFYELWDRCLQASRDRIASVGLNDQLLLEGVAMTCASLARPRGGSPSSRLF